MLVHNGHPKILYVFPVFPQNRLRLPYLVALQREYVAVEKEYIGKEGTSLWSKTILIQSKNLLQKRHWDIFGLPIFTEKYI